MNEYATPPEYDLTGLALVVALERQNKRLTWRELSKTLGIDKALLTGLPDTAGQLSAEGVVSISKWLGVPADTFMRADAHAKRDRRRIEIKQRVLGYALPPHSAIPQDESEIESALRFQLLMADARPYGLDEHEWSVLELICAGLMLREIAERLYLSQQVVAACVWQILQKLSAANMEQARVVARQRGWFAET